MIGIIVAMNSELRLIETLLEEKQEIVADVWHFLQGKIGNRDVVVLQSGIGKVCAAAGTVEMIRRFAPQCILNTGVAGGIDPSLRVMDVVIAKEVCYHDVWCGDGNEKGQIQGLPARYESDTTLYQMALSIQSDILLHGGLICSGDQFITDFEHLQTIKEDFPTALAVDMESGAIAQICYLYRVPFLSCRIISDTPGYTEHHALQYKNFWTIAPEKSFEILKQIIQNTSQ